MKLASALSLLVSLLSPLPAFAGPSDDIPIYAVSLVGRPYRLGGASPESGLDCSGFVGHVFKQITGLQLPRDSRSISDATQPLTQDELQPGDLVFFNTLNRTFSHVGIYLGEDRFVHASSNCTGQVMVSNLNETYWRTRFDGARRVLDPLPVVDGGCDFRYLAYFACFNTGRYFEAHEVLEGLWLTVRREPHGPFYQGLIQLAGALVHLQKGRVGPARRLLPRARFHLERYGPRHGGLELGPVLQLIDAWGRELESDGANRMALSLTPGV